MSKVGVLGAGTWGMALARMLANSGHDVTVWSALEDEIEILRKDRRHPKLLNVISFLAFIIPKWYYMSTYFYVFTKLVKLV